MELSAKPSEAEIFLLVSTIIKESIIEVAEIDTQEREDEVQDLVSDMVNGLLDTLDVRFIAWSPSSAKALVTVEPVEPTEYFE